jgi:hypothetical protein
MVEHKSLLPYNLNTLISSSHTGGGGLSYVPVTGTLTIDGKLAEGVTLSFLPEADGTNASATTSPMGGFSVRTSDKEGCPPGKYAVTVIKLEAPKNAKQSAASSIGPSVDMAMPVNTLPDKFSKKETSGISVVVERGMKPLELAITTK